MWDRIQRMQQSHGTCPGGPMPREGRAAAQCCGYRKVKGPENTEALFGYPEHLKRLPLCEVGCAFSTEEELWMAGPNVAKAKSSG